LAAPQFDRAGGMADGIALTITHNFYNAVETGKIRCRKKRKTPVFREWNNLWVKVSGIAAAMFI